MFVNLLDNTGKSLCVQFLWICLPKEGGQDMWQHPTFPAGSVTGATLLPSAREPKGKQGLVHQSHGVSGKLPGVTADPWEPCLTNADGKVILGSQQTSPSNLRKMTKKPFYKNREIKAKLSEIKFTHMLPQKFKKSLHWLFLKRIIQHFFPSLPYQHIETKNCLWFIREKHRRKPYTVMVCLLTRAELFVLVAAFSSLLSLKI